MNTTVRTLRQGTALVATLLAAFAVHAADPGYDTYRRVVNGDTRVEAPQATTDNAPRIVAGPYARYLINRGMSEAQALSNARDAGEIATIDSAQPVAVKPLSSYQIYERVMGRSING